jgi:deoxyribodipyrimidine photo-lyase
MIHESRVRILNDKPVLPDKPFVLYWMQQSQRTLTNHALEAAALKANKLSKPLVVCFGLMDDYPEATERHYAFMLQGLRDVARALKDRGIRFVVHRGEPKDAAVRFAKDAACVVVDRGYLRHLRRWRDHVADTIACRLVEIDTDVVVPIEAASNKHEIAARTIRPKIHRIWNDYLHPLKPAALTHSSLKLKIESDVELSDVDAALKSIRCDRGVKTSATFTGGEVEAQRRLAAFVQQKLKGYAEGRNEPADGWTSGLSPYLQYGQISPIDMALAARSATRGEASDKDSFVEELIVRRELSHNFCVHHPDYDRFEALPGWARASLAKHAADKREYVYTYAQLEAAQTHDRYWNAAQTEMVNTGYMHNYMRMYWAKKILEWTPRPQDAFDIALKLNNRFLLDGLNANSYGNVGWTFGLFDRPWGERPIFGVVRYMNAAGLERKFDIERYVRKVAGLELIRD